MNEKKVAALLAIMNDLYVAAIETAIEEFLAEFHKIEKLSNEALGQFDTEVARALLNNIWIIANDTQVKYANLKKDKE